MTCLIALLKDKIFGKKAKKKERGAETLITQDVVLTSFQRFHERYGRQKDAEFTLCFKKKKKRHL